MRLQLGATITTSHVQHREADGSIYGYKVPSKGDELVLLYLGVAPRGHGAAEDTVFSRLHAIGFEPRTEGCEAETDELSGLRKRWDAWKRRVGIEGSEG